MGTQLNVSLIVECALVNEDLSKIETKVTFKKRKKMIKSQKKKRNNLKRTYLLKVFRFFQPTLAVDMVRCTLIKLWVGTFWRMNLKNVQSFFLHRHFLLFFEKK